ncbi:MAG: hypothetical protein IT518_12955 [Burkholderiales bacterium]|nr:hypothetical protein [Burkholderiales bacterium]
MKRLWNGLLLVLAVALLAACAQLPLQQREVVVPLSRLTEALARRLGEDRKFLDVFTLRIGDPQLATDPVAQRLRADFAITLTHPFSSRPLTGRAALSGALGYDAEARNVTLVEPRLDRLDIDAVPPALRDVSSRLASALGRELVGSFPLVSLRDKDLTAYGRNYRVAGFELVEQGVRVTLRAVD